MNNNNCRFLNTHTQETRSRFCLKKNIFLLIVISFSLLCACSNNTMSKLREIDSLAHDNTALAMIELMNIDSTMLATPETRAYHGLLNTRLEHSIYGIARSEGPIINSIEYYLSSRDSSHAAECFFYKANIEYFDENKEKAFADWKKAEELSRNKHDSLRLEIVDRLFNLAWEFNDSLSLNKYAEIMYNEALQYHNRKWVALDRLALARGIIYKAVSDNNSKSIETAKKALALVNYKPDLEENVYINSCPLFANLFDKSQAVIVNDTIIGTYSTEGIKELKKIINEMKVSKSLPLGKRNTSYFETDSSINNISYEQAYQVINESLNNYRTITGQFFHINIGNPRPYQKSIANLFQITTNFLKKNYPDSIKMISYLSSRKYSYDRIFTFVNDDFSESSKLLSLSFATSHFKLEELNSSGIPFEKKIIMLDSIDVYEHLSNLAIYYLSQIKYNKNSEEVKINFKNQFNELYKWIDKSQNTRAFNRIKQGSDIKRVEILQIRTQKKLWISIAMTLMVIILGLFVYLNFKHKKEQEIDQLTEQIDNDIASIHRLHDIENTILTEKIKTLSLSIEKKTKELEKSKNKLKAVKSVINNSQSANRSLILLSSILQNRNISQLSNDERDEFLRNFRLINSAYSKYIDALEISPNNKLMLILYYLGKTDVEVCQILQISNGALRTRKSRMIDSTDKSSFKQLIEAK